MTLDERLEYMLSNIPSQYDTSVGSFIRDILYPVAEQFDLRSQHAEQIEYDTLRKLQQVHIWTGKQKNKI